MPIFTTTALAVAGLVVGAAGTAASIKASSDAKKDAQKQAGAVRSSQAKAERQLKEKSDLDAATSAAYEARRKQRSGIGGGFSSTVKNDALGIPGGAGQYEKKTLLGDVA